MHSRGPLKKISEKFLSLVEVFETSLYLMVSAILFGVSLIAVFRVLVGFFALLMSITEISMISFENFQNFFGKVLTLLIILELKATILHAIKKRGIKSLLLDIILIAGTAISRKLITMDYTKMEPDSVLAMSALLTAIGLSYFLIRRATLPRNRNRQSQESREQQA